jgi:predicted glycosyltransferase
MNGAEESARILTRFLEQRGAKPTNDIPHSSASQLHPTNDLAGSEAERQPMRLMVYSHDTFGLGNIRRMLSICNHLHESIDDLSILIISGSPMLQSFRVGSGIDYIKLPCLKRSESGALGVKFLPMEAEEIIRLRRELILSTVVSFKPDVVLVDKKPDGLASELEPALRHIRCALPNTLVSLVLRDILDDPGPTIETWTKHGYNNILHWYYDKVLVLGSRSIYDVCAEYEIPAVLSRKFVYCGYVAREDKLQDRSKLRHALGVGEDTSLVLATAGGGEDGFNVLLKSIEASQRLSPSLNPHTLVVTGPEMPSFKRSQLIAAAAHSPAISVVEFLPDLLSHMNTADVVISMGGYNSICELATLNKHAIIVPREIPVREQSIRMERIGRYGPILTISPRDLDAHALCEAIQTQLQNCHRCDSGVWHLDMGALPRISRLIEQHAQQSTSPATVARLPHTDSEGDFLKEAVS